MGTQIEWLRNIFSLNILLVSLFYLILIQKCLIIFEQLQRIFQSLKHNCGSSIIHQSHKNSLPAHSLEMFTMIANNQDILAQFSTKTSNGDSKVEDTYSLGIWKLRKRIRNGDMNLQKFKSHLHVHRTVDTQGDEGSGSSDDGESQAGEMEV